MTKKHKKKMHAAAWSPAARRKRAATYAAKRAQREAKGTPEVIANGKLYTGTIKDVIVFLEHAEAAILKSGNKRISAAESYAMLALTTLRGN